jgi:glycosyltransferase involved in cell wall biosynthesis
MLTYLRDGTLVGNDESILPGPAVRIRPEIERIRRAAPHPGWPRFAAMEARLRGIFRQELTGACLCIAYNVLFFPEFFMVSACALADVCRNTPGVALVLHNDEADPRDSQLGLMRMVLERIQALSPPIHTTFVSDVLRTDLQRRLSRELPCRILPNFLNIAEELRLNPETIEIFRRRRLLSKDLLLFLPAINRENNNIELAVEILHVLVTRHRIDSVLLLTLTDSEGTSRSDFRHYCRRIRGLVTRIGLDERVVFLSKERPEFGEGLAHRILVDFYRLADVLFYASRHEGFGLPLLECGVHRLPIVCSALPVFREIGGEDVVCVDTRQDAGAVSRALLEALAWSREHRMFKRTLRLYSDDAFVRLHLVPLLQDVLGVGMVRADECY